MFFTSKWGRISLALSGTQNSNPASEYDNQGHKSMTNMCVWGEGGGVLNLGTVPKFYYVINYDGFP